MDAVIVNEAGPPGIVVANALRTTLEADGGTATIVPDAATAEAAVEDGIGDGRDHAAGRARDAAGADHHGPDRRPRPVRRGGARWRPSVGPSLAAAAVDHRASRPPTIDHTTLYGTPSSDPITTFAPAIVGFFAYFFVYLLTGVSFLRERTGGTLERLMATPVTRGEVVTGYILGFGLFATLQVVAAA